MSNVNAAVQTDVTPTSQSIDAARVDVQTNGTPASQNGDPASSRMLTIGEAALKLGISERTCRRWIKSGKLAVERIPITTGFSYRIASDVVAELAALANDVTEQSAQTTTLPADQQASRASQNGHSSTYQNGQASSPAILLDMLQESRDEIRVLNKELRDLSGIASMHQTRSQMLEERLQLLQAPSPQRRWYYLWLKAA